MNERIKEMALKARLGYVLLNKEYPYIEDDLNNFAKMIVKECAAIAFAGKSENLDEYDRGWQNGRNTAAILIEELTENT